MGEESSKTVGGESKDCSSNGSPVDCGASGGHPGYVQCVDQEMSESKIQELANVVTLGDTDQVYPGACCRASTSTAGVSRR